MIGYKNAGEGEIQEWWWIWWWISLSYCVNIGISLSTFTSFLVFDILNFSTFFPSIVFFSRMCKRIRWWTNALSTVSFTLKRVLIPMEISIRRRFPQMIRSVHWHSRLHRLQLQTTADIFHCRSICRQLFVEWVDPIDWNKLLRISFWIVLHRSNLSPIDCVNSSDSNLIRNSEMKVARDLFSSLFIDEEKKREEHRRNFSSSSCLHNVTMNSIHCKSRRSLKNIVRVVQQMFFDVQSWFPSVFFSMISDCRRGVSKLFFFESSFSPRSMFVEDSSILGNHPLKPLTNADVQISLCLVIEESWSDRPIVHHWSIGFVRGKNQMWKSICLEPNCNGMGKESDNFFSVFEVLESAPASTSIDTYAIEDQSGKDFQSKSKERETIKEEKNGLFSWCFPLRNNVQRGIYNRLNTFNSPSNVLKPWINKITADLEEASEFSIDDRMTRRNKNISSEDQRKKSFVDAFAIVSSASKKSSKISLFTIERKIWRNRRVPLTWQNEMFVWSKRSEKCRRELHSIIIDSISLLNIGIKQKENSCHSKEKDFHFTSERRSIIVQQWQTSTDENIDKRSDLIDDIVRINNQRNLSISLSFLEIWRKMPNRCGRGGNRRTFAETFAMIFKRDKWRCRGRHVDDSEDFND